MPEDLKQQIEKKLKDINELLVSTLEGSKNREGLIDGFKIAIIGKPNVGKSSLLNAMLNYDRAIISDIAGTTRDTIEESIKIDTHLVKFVDTAGIREADESIEKIGIKRSIDAICNADIVIALFDSSSNFDKNDKNIVNLLHKYKSSKEIVVAINKNDLTNKLDTDELKEFNPIKISTKQSVQIIRDQLSNILNQKSDADDLILISKRQINAVTDALKHIDKSSEFLNEELELFSYHLNEAIYHISSITKIFQRDEILDKMFGSFCLGK